MIPNIDINLTGLTVATFHKMMELLKLPVDKKEQLNQLAGKQTLKVIRQYQKNNQLPVNDKFVADEPTIQYMVAQLRQFGYLDNEYKKTISGVVKNEADEGLPNAMLGAVDIDLMAIKLYKNVQSVQGLMNLSEGFEFLGTTKTDNKGFYKITFYDWMYAKSERRSADVVVYAVDGQKSGPNDLIIGRSELFQNVANQTSNVDIIVKKLDRKVGEYKVLYEAIAGFLKENRMAMSDIFDSQEHISFIASELGLSLDKTQLIVLANAIEASVKGTLYAELLYGLGMQKLGLDWGNLHRTSDDDLRKALDQSILEMHIDKFPAVKVNAFLDLLKTVAATKMLDSSANETNIANEFLAISLSKPSERVAFVKASNQYTGTDEDEFWNTYLPKQTGFKAGTIKSLRDTQKLFVISGAYLPIVSQLAKSGLKELTDLVKWDLSNWENLVKKSGFPDTTAGDEKLTKIRNYAKYLQNTVNGEYATAAIQHKIATKGISIINPKVHKTLIKFLGSTKDFDLKTSNINDFRDKLGDEEAVQELKGLQRLVRINPDTSLIPVLQDRGLLSALQIAEYPRKTFKKEFGEALGGATNAMLIYDNAVLAQSKVNLIETGIRDFSDGFMPNWIIDPKVFDTTRTLIEERFPGYSRIFNVNLCECKHCNSVYSPAAYFVDLMRYLQKGTTNSEGESPSDIFQKRRPDLFHLPLTCENSNTLIPYIDLVNEVMENYIFYTYEDSSDIDFSQFRSGDIDGATEQELRAQAQYIESETYRILAEESVFPSSLPFNLPLEILQTYSKQLGISWYGVLNTTLQFAPSVATDNTLNAAVLGLSEIEFAAITRQDFDGGNTLAREYWRYYGFETEVLLQGGLAAVPEFLRRTGLKYIDLISLLQTGFINPNLPLLAYVESIIKEVVDLNGREVYEDLHNVANNGADLPREIVLVLDEKSIEIDAFVEWIRDNFDNVKQVLTLFEETSACDIAMTEIKSVANLYETPDFRWTESLGLNINSFLRLCRKTGWSMDQLDTVLKALSIEAFNPGNLGLLAKAKRFIDKTNTDPKHAAVLWGDIGYWHKNSLYQELFLNKTIGINSVFTLQIGSEPLQNIDSVIDVYVADIQSVLYVSEAELVSIYEHAGINILSEPISLGNISLAYRYVWFANLRGISITELIQYIQLFELDPFAGPENSLFAFERIAAARNSNFAIEELSYVFGAVLPEEDRHMGLGDLLQLEYHKIDSQEMNAESAAGAEVMRLSLKQSFTYNYLGDYLAISSEIIEALGASQIDNLITAFNIEDWEQLVNDLKKAATVILKFKLTDEESIFFAENGDELEGLDLQNLTQVHWWYLHDYVVFREKLPTNHASPISLLAYAIPGSMPPEDEFIETIRVVTGWAETDIRYLLSRYSAISEFRLEQVLYSLQEVILLTNRIGISPESFVGLVPMNDLAPANWSFDLLWEKSQAIKRIVKSKYVGKTWNSVATKLNDALREKQRDALISYLLSLDFIRERGISDANGLYEFFLIDVQMSACMDTSRIVQASAAVQQFVNRIKLNLEDEVAQDALDRNRWQWMQYYRVWEAQMRIWYENPIYLNPEWRMDKSEFFEELESHLTQNDINDRSAEEALRGYLKSMDEVANLNVAGFYEEKDSDGNKKTLHVFGHTQHTPYKYYYRTYNFRYDKWSAWRKVDAAIQPVVNTDDVGKSGVHLIPVVWKNRLLLLWPEFMEKAENKTSVSNEIFENLGGNRVSSQEPKKYWEVRLAWSELYDGKWTAKQLSKTGASIYQEAYDRFRRENKNISLSDVSFSVVEKTGQLSIYLTPINLFVNSYSTGVRYLNTFTIEDISNGLENEKLELDVLYNFDDYDYSLLEYPNIYLSKYSNNFDQKKHIDNGYYTKPLFIGNSFLNAGTDHILVFPNLLHPKEHPIDYPFFYSSRNKTYFVVNKPIAVSRSIRLNNNTNNFYGNNSIPDFVREQFQNASIQIVQPQLHFSSFHHPFVADFISNLNKNGIGTNDYEKPGLMESDALRLTSNGKQYEDTGVTFESMFEPNFPYVFKPADLTDPLRTYYKETIDFDANGANSKYNWELFFHAPLYIATQLGKNGKFEEALKWFHYIFDPTTDEIPDLGLEEVSRFWKVKPFKYDVGDSFQDFIEELTANSGEEDPIIAEWRDNPFNPHLVAANFPVNYKKHTLLAYVENLVEWGDSKFRKFTRENVYEAIQLYVLAGHILGPKPPFVPSRGTVKKETFETLDDKLNDLSNARVEMENSIGYSSGIHDVDGRDSPAISGTGLAFYFCITPNEKLLKYWEIVEDRLYKIRNCKDINGVARRLALFAPPIDPAVLIKAKSAGLDLDTILSEFNNPNPHYRFAYLIQKANEFCNDVKGLGNALLSAIEKQDGEVLSQLRSTHEIDMLNMIQGVKERQVLDAKLAVGQLEKQRETAASRFVYYNETLLGNEPVNIPEVIPLSASLNDDSQVSINSSIQEIVPDVDVSLVDLGERGLKVIPKEREDIDLRKSATILSTVASGTKLAASIAALFPTIGTKGQPLGVGIEAGFGGQNVALGLQFISEASQTVASTLSQAAALASTGGSYIRREQEWTNQANLVIKEIESLEIQILSAGIRLQVAEKDLENHKRQIENANAIETYIRDKFSNKELYSWMKDQLISLHKQSYDMAFEMAKKAEMAYEFEKGPLDDLPIIDYSYWDNSRYGLLSGEKLQLGLRRMDVAYLEENTRQFELTKHISLKRLSPIELIKLRETGECHLTIPEELFDLDYPGHYKRTIKSVSISIPCVAGPYTTIPCTLSLTSNKKRINTFLVDGTYADTSADGSSDDRFITQNIPVSSIATSSAQNDSGVFELNFRDERFVPFEGAGVISNWVISLFNDSRPTPDNFGKAFRQFDYSTIGDVILNINYTAEADDTLKESALGNLKTYFESIGNAPSFKIFDLKRDFPSEWNRFLHPASGSGESILNLKLSPNHFPYRDQMQDLNISEIKLIVDSTESNPFSIALVANPSNTFLDATTDNLHGFGNLQVLSSEALTEVSFEFRSVQEIEWMLRIEKADGEPLNENDVKEMFMILNYSVSIS